MPFSSDNILLDDSITGNTASFNLIRLSGTNINNIFYSTTNASPDNFVTGGTLNRNTDTLTLFRTNGSINITGITDTFLTGGTFNSTTGVLTLSQNERIPDIIITGFSTGSSTGSTSLDLQTVSASATTTSTSTSSTWVDVGSMSLTVKNLGSSATTYTVNFSCTAALSGSGGVGGWFRLVLNGNEIPFSLRKRTNSTQTVSLRHPIAINTSVTNVKSGDIIKVQFNSAVGQWTVNDRSLTIMGVLTQNLV